MAMNESVKEKLSRRSSRSTTNTVLPLRGHLEKEKTRTGVVRTEAIYIDRAHSTMAILHVSECNKNSDPMYQDDVDGKQCYGQCLKQQHIFY